MSRSVPAGKPPLLEIDGLRVTFPADGGAGRAVDGVSLTVAAGERVALVGESGSGKTVTALAVLGLVDPPGRIDGGDVRLDGRSLVGLDEDGYRSLRGRDIAMVFQDPLSALNPVLRVGDQVAEAVLVHSGAPTRAEARRRAVELLAAVGIPDPERGARAYPHQLSGGMRQRVLLAAAIANGPRLLIADEPTTALDVTVQAQVLELLGDVQARTGAALLLITHDLGVVAGLADRVLVMYAGRIVEDGAAADVFARPAHPYTRALLASVPVVDARRTLVPIRGVPPAASQRPAGCAFHPRCDFAQDRCREVDPGLIAATGRPAHRSACLRAGELAHAEGAREAGA